MKLLRNITAALAALVAGTSYAQSGDTVKIIVPFAAGGPADQIARIVSTPLGTILGKPVVVDNRGGAGGVIGVAAAAKSPADGSTLLLTTSSLVITAGTTPNLPYNPRKDLEPVYLLGEVQTVLAVRPTLGVNTLSELVEKAKGEKKLNYGSTGVGGTMHIGAELFAKAAQVSMVHVPYRGAAPALTDLMAGTVDLVNADVPVLRPYVNEGRLKALVIYDTKRSPQLPDVPTAAEAGLPALQMSNWYGVLVPAGMAPELRKRFEDALSQVVRQPKVAARLAEAGFSGPRDSQAFKSKLDADFNRWIPWLRSAGIQSN
ncbi:MAG: tripartite tricarboxylate transporter substrate-binding protein [Ottowia sp.]|uniref:Bug family tripartite tricarboxylate transporter substrate binding protein n=1 Tax=Ottowia sp. TaxID=1898956 RepID=UPI003C797038